MTRGSNFSDLYHDENIIDAYKIAEKITVLFAKDLVDLAGVAGSCQPRLTILDSACGTAVISEMIHEALRSRGMSTWDLTCSDISAPLLACANGKIQEKGWLNTKAKLLDSQDTGLPAESFTHVMVGFALTAIPDPKSAMQDCFRILQPGGTLALSTWKSPGWFSILEAAVARMPGKLPFPTLGEFFACVNEGWDSEDYVYSQLEQEGFSKIHVCVVSKKVATTIEEYMKIIEHVVPFIMDTFWGAELKAKHEKGFWEQVQHYLQETYGATGMVPQEWAAVFASGRK